MKFKDGFIQYQRRYVDLDGLAAVKDRLNHLNLNRCKTYFKVLMHLAFGLAFRSDFMVQEPDFCIETFCPVEYSTALP